MKIVLADDDEATRILVVDAALERGYEITTVHNGAELLRLLESGLRNYDVVVTDNSMPGGPDGVEVLRRLAAGGILKDAPVILQSWNTDVALKRAVEGLGAVFVPKHSTFAPLFEVIDGLAKS